MPSSVDSRKRDSYDCARVVAGRGEVRDAVAVNVVDGLRDDAVFEHRLGEVDDVVDDDLRAGGRQRANARGEVFLAFERRVERQRRARRHVVDELHHRAPFVGAVVARCGARDP